MSTQLPEESQSRPSDWTAPSNTVKLFKKGALRYTLIQSWERWYRRFSEEIERAPCVYEALAFTEGAQTVALQLESVRDLLPCLIESDWAMLAKIDKGIPVNKIIRCYTDYMRHRFWEVYNWRKYDMAPRVPIESQNPIPRLTQQVLRISPGRTYYG